MSASGGLEGSAVQGDFTRQSISRPMSPDRGLELSIRAIRRQLTAMPCDRYLVRLIHHASRKALPGQRLWTVSQLADEAVVRFLRARNRDGYDIYCRPFVPDGNAGYILVDLDRARPAVLDAMFDLGHEPCVVTETSPGHFQAWVRMSVAPLSFAIATTIARQLAQLYQADRASADGRHLGRLAGFTNQKPQRRLATGLPPWVKVRHAALTIASQPPAVEQTPLPWLAQPRAVVQTTEPVVVGADSRADLSAVATDALTRGEAIAIYQTVLDRLRILQRFPTPDWSIVDLWIAKELLGRQIPAERVRAVLQLASPHFPRSHGDSQDYLRRTLARALFRRAMHGAAS